MNSINRGGGITSVEIGGRTYPVVRIGDQYWLAENLDWKWPGLVIGGSSSNAGGWYIGNNESLWGATGRKVGLLYNYAAVIELNNLLTNGWRVPSIEDFKTLANFIGGSNSQKLKAASASWSSGWSGTDEFGFSAVPGGYCFGPNEFALYDIWAVFSTISEREQAGRMYGCGLNAGDNLIYTDNDSNKIAGLSVRLVKDV